jgi:hypothetical protein
MDVAPPVVGALKTGRFISIKSLFRITSCSQEGGAGLAALSAGLLFPKRLPPSVFELEDVPVAAAVMLPVVLELPALGNKLPVEAPVPEARGFAPAAAGFGKPNGDAEIDRKEVYFRN